jgi:GAF domain-containing protein/CheY-like chemotaxis protein
MVLVRDAAARHEGRLAAAVEATRAAVEEARQALQREARLLARDPAVLAGLARNDWATLARGASPRLTSLAADRVGDLILVVDAAGAAQVRIPATLRQPALAPTTTSGIQAIDGGLYVVGAAPILADGPRDERGPGRQDPPPGTVLVGRRLDRLAMPAALVAMDGDRLLAASLPDAPASGWDAARRDGTVVVAGASWGARPIDGTDLIALVRDADHEADRRRLALGLGGSIALLVAGAGGAAWAMGRRARLARAVPDDQRAPPGGAGHGTGDRWRRRDPEAGRRQLEALVRLSRALTGTLAPDDVLQRIVDATVEIFGCSNSTLWLLDEDGRTLTVRASAGSTAELPDRRWFALGEGLVGWIGATRTPLTVADVATDPRTVHAVRLRDAGIVSFAGVPLLLGERLLGVLATTLREPYDDSGMEIGLLQVSADYAAIALDTARRFSAESLRRAHFRAVLEITARIGSRESTGDLLGLIAEEAARLLDVDNAGFRLVEGDDLVLAGLAGTAAQTMLKPRLKIGESLAGRIVARGEPLVGDLEEFAAELDPSHLAADRRLGYRTYLGVPLRVGERTIGVLSFRARRPFTRADQELAEVFAGQASIALENERLYREATRQAERMRALADVERLLTETLAPDAVAQRVADSISTLLGARSAVLYRLDGEGMLEAQAISSSSPFPWTRRLPPGHGIAGLAIRERRPVHSPDVLVDDRIDYGPEVRTIVEGTTDRALLAVPVFVRDGVSGALAVSHTTGRVFDDGEVRLAEAFAAQAATAIENARVYDEAERRRLEAEELARIARVLTETLDVAAVGDRIVDSVRALFGVESAGLRVLEPDGSLLAVAWRGAGTEFFSTGDRLPAGRGLLGRAVAEGRPAWTIDLQADESVEYPEEMRRRVIGAGQRGALAVPLRAKGSTVGALFLAHSRVYAFSEAEIALAQTVADQAALALENARLHEESERRRRAAEQLAELGRLISQSLEPARVGESLAARIREMFGALRATLYRLGADGQEVEVVGFSGDGGPMLGEKFDLRRGRVLIGRALRERRAVATSSALTDPALAYPEDLLPRIVTTEVRAVMAAPLFRGDAPIGVLAVGDREGRVFTDEEIARLEACADRAAVALDNARLYSETARRQREAEALARLGQALTESLDVAAVADRIVESLLALFDANSSSLRLLQPDGSVVTLATAGAARPHYPPGLVMGPGIGLIARAIAEGRALWSSDRFADPDVVLTDDARARGLAAGTRAALVAPLRAKGRIIGALSVYHDRPRTFSEGEIVLCQAFADQAGLALENARLYAETERRLEETRALLEVAELLNSTLDPTQLLKRVAMKIAQVCRVDRCSIEIWEEDRVVPLMAQFADGRHRPDLWQRYTRLPRPGVREIPAHAQVIETRRPVVIDDASATDLIPREWIEAYGLRSYMAVPLIRQDQVIGVMNLDHCQRVTPFSPRQVDLAVGIAGQVALALENTRLYTEVRERLRETTALLAVARALSQTGPLDERLRQVAREVARALEASAVGIFGLDASGDALLPIAGYRVPKHLLAFLRGTSLPLSEMPGLAAAWRAGRTVTSADGRGDLRFHPDLFAAVDPCSVMWTPTRRRGEPVGGIYVLFWGTGREFRPAEIRLLEGIAAQVGLALENAELTRQTEIKLHETETLLSVSRAIASTLDIEAMLRQFLRTLAGVLSADSVGVCLTEDDETAMVPAQGYRVPPEHLDRIRGVRLPLVGSTIYAEARHSRRPVFVPETADDPRVPRAVVDALPHASQLFVPIFAKQRFIGGFVALWYRPRGAFADHELTLMEAVADQAGLGIENARLFEQNRRQVEELSVLHEMSRAVTGEFDRAALVNAIYTEVGRVLAARHMVILLADGDDYEVALRMDDGAPNDGPPRRYRPGTVGLASVVMRLGHPLRTDDYLAECARRGVEPVVAASSLPFWLGAPMIADGTVLGVVVLRRPDRPYSAADERFLANIADLGALALRSARLFEERSRAYSELAAAQDHLVRTEKLRALGEMASGVAHDFNNLLAAILGRAQLMLTRVQDPTLVGWLQIIERSALDGAQTVRRMQEFARVRRDQSFVVVDLNEIVQGALEITQSRWREESLRKGILVDVRTHLESVPLIAGDPAELREALTNLILNALDAMPTGGTLSIGTSLGAHGVELTVSDSGVGIPDDVREKIFDPFFTTKGPQGTGLGLSMTYGIVSRHGGLITVESRQGTGTTFRLVFPVGTARAGVGEGAAPSPALTTQALRCLVIDDEESVATVLSDMLEAVGHSAHPFTDPATAIDRFRTEPFDVVFTDLAMPGTTGWDVARAVKAMAPTVPVFVVTGFGVELSAEERRAHGVADILAKPLKIADVVSLLAQVEHRRRDPAEEE